METAVVVWARIYRDCLSRNGGEGQTLKTVVASGKGNVLPSLACMKAQDIPIDTEESKQGSMLLLCTRVPRSQPKMME